MKNLSSFIVLIILAFLSITPVLGAGSNAVITGDNNTYYSSSEYFKSFNTKIVIEKDGTLDITETIIAQAANININHGIYRDFPIYYTLPFGFKSSKSFTLIDIKRDGRSERYKEDSIQNGIRIYIGDEDIVIPPGEYTYTIHYKTGRQFGFFDTHDELNYNLIGTDWVFPIQRATASITFPSSIKISEGDIKVFTGRNGSTESNATISLMGNTISYKLTNPLSSQEGMTTAIKFQKNTFEKLSTTEETALFITNNILIFIATLGAIGLSAFYIVFWYMFGRDKGTSLTVVQFDPVDGISAGAARYLSQMSYDMKALTASITELATRGKIKIQESGASDSPRTSTSSIVSENSIMKTASTIFGTVAEYSVIKVASNISDLPEDLKELYANLFKSSDSITFTQSNHSRIKSIVDGYSHSLGKLYGNGKFFTSNLFLIAIGIFVSIIIGLLLIVHAGRYSGENGIGPFIFGSLWVGAVMLMIRQYLVNKNLDIFRLFLGAVVFLIGSCVGILILFFSIDAVSLLGIVTILITLLVSIVFIPIMPARSKTGRDLQNQLDGLKKYLSLAEEKRIQFFNKELPHDMKTFEKLLPFAIAFDIETQWTAEFAETIKKAQVDGYEPSWYSGSYVFFYSSNFGHSFANSLSSTLSTSSVDPSSSSGFSGGSSGGGGGGGGGGGW